MTHLAVFSSY